MKILLQLLIFTFFIFSNGYQSLVTSFMLNPMQEKLLKTINELLESDLNIAYDGDFHSFQQDNPKYQKAFLEDRIIFDLEDSKKYAKIEFCRIMEFNMKSGKNGKTTKEGLYLIPEPIYYQQSDIFIRSFHPYLEKFQEIMDSSFEAGLMIYWRKYYLEIWKLVYGERREIKEEQKVLDFGLIAPFFLILLFGFFAAFLALCCEIFWKDFISELTKEYFKRKYENFFGSEIKVMKVKVRKAKVRRIQVKPVSTRKAV